MNLDRGDESQNYDPFYNPMNGGSTAVDTGIELKAQNQYMGKDTAQKQQFWSPEGQEVPKTNEPQKDELDDLEALEDFSLQESQPKNIGVRSFQPQNYPGAKPEDPQDK